MALNNLQITALLTKWDKSEDESEHSHDENDNEVQNIFENDSNVELIDINDFPVEVTNINGKFVSIPQSHDFVESYLSTTSNKI